MNISAVTSTQPTFGIDEPGPIQLPTGGTGPYAPPPDGFDAPDSAINGDDLIFADVARAPQGGKGAKVELECPAGQHVQSEANGRKGSLECVDDKPAGKGNKPPQEKPAGGEGGKPTPGGAPIIE